MVHQYKDYAYGEANCKLTAIVKTDLLPSTSPVYLQIYNRITPGWEEIDSDSTSGIGVDITLEAIITDLTNYKDAVGMICCRIYQEAT